MRTVIYRTAFYSKATSQATLGATALPGFNRQSGAPAPHLPKVPSKGAIARHQDPIPSTGLGCAPVAVRQQG
jgi:hypothetical protein